MNEDETWSLICFAVVLVLAFVTAITVFQKNKTTKENAFVSGNSTAVERAGAPVKGPKDAKVTIVEFFDPACGTCSEFYPLVKKLMDQYPGKVNVMMRYAPLHQGSDQVVKMLEAAHLQGKFWPALELLFANQQRWVANHISQPMLAKGLLDTLDLNKDQLSTDWNSAKVSDAIQQDTKDAQTLNVTATPEFFVNGRPLPSWGYEQLQDLVKQVVAESY